MTVTRSQTGKTPKKPELPEGIVETPSRRRSTRRQTPAHSTASPSPTRTAMARDVGSKSNGHANGHVNWNANGQPNGTAAKAKATKPRIIDGWLEGSDPKIDADPHFDFGGTPGVIMMMIGFPALMWYMWVGAHYYDGKFPSRSSSDESYLDFAKHLVQLAYTGAFPHRRAWAIYWVFGIAQSVFYYFLPGVYVKGKPLPHLENKQLTYYCSGMWSFYVTIAAAIGLHVTGLFKLYTLIDEFGPIMSVAILSGFIVSFVAYISAIARGAQHRMTGYPIYDFFMGAELNPRMFGWIDMKMFFEVRLPWYILFLVTLGGAARQWETYGYVTPEMSFLLMAHFLYANACAKGEELIPVCWDVFYEKWGFMLIFWNMAGVPLSYCHCTIFLANHDPSEYSHSRVTMFFFFTSYVFMYWVWDTGNSQAKFFRAEERGYHIQRAAFPQLPWKKIDKPEKITSDCGDSILCDGWYKMARKIHYTCDLYFALTWGLMTGFNSPFPWFYPAFFAVMIIHRAIRDVQRCRNKYGAAWEEYERRVPAMFIPYVI